MLTTSPSALFRSNSLNLRCSSAIRPSITTNDSRVNGRNKQRSSEEIELKSSIIFYAACTGRTPPYTAHRTTDRGLAQPHHRSLGPSGRSFYAAIRLVPKFAQIPGLQTTRGKWEWKLVVCRFGTFCLAVLGPFLDFANKLGDFSSEISGQQPFGDHFQWQRSQFAPAAMTANIPLTC